MREVYYLRACMALPMVVPVLAIASVRLGVDSGKLLSILVWSLFVGGIPYAAFAIVSVIIMWNRPPIAYWRWAMLAPLAFSVIFSVALTLAGVIERGTLPPLDVIFGSGAYYSLVIVPVGYGYVGLTWLGYKLLSKFEIVNEAV